MIAPAVQIAMAWTFFMLTDQPYPVQVRGAPTFTTREECVAELYRREVIGAFCHPKEAKP